MVLRMQGTDVRHVRAHPAKAFVTAQQLRTMFAAIWTSVELPPAPLSP
jgi:hypothetical protein